MHSFALRLLRFFILAVRRNRLPTVGSCGGCTSFVMIFFAAARYAVDSWPAPSVGAWQSIRWGLAFFDSIVFTFALRLIRLPSVGYYGGCTMFVLKVFSHLALAFEKFQ